MTLVKMENMVETKWGGLDFPSYNPKWDGVAKHRYTYMLEIMAKADYDENYTWPVLKYDSVLEKVVASWGPPMTISQEPRFIDNPYGSEEEDGVIMQTVYDFKHKTTSLVIIDPKTMTTLQEYKLPFKLPLQFHNNYFPRENASQPREESQ